MGIPWVQAPSEGEAQASYLVRKGDAFCAGSQDFDSLLFGAPLLVRNLAITGKRKLPRRNVYVDVKPEIFSLSKSLEKLQINREQLIDIAILIGTDFNPGIKGIGPKTALKLVKKHDSLLSILKELGEEIENYELIQDFFREPEVTSSYEIRRGEPQEEKIISFLCDLHDFSTERVKKAVQKLLSSFNSARQATLDRFW
jgi:flap endonuclease-1